jgi:hypothetical protein
MMNRSVMQRQMFKYGGDVKKMMYGGDVKKMEMGGAPTGQMATFVNPESGERITLDMANESDVQMMDQLVAAGYVMDSPSEAPRASMAEMMSAARNLYEAPQPIGGYNGPGGMQEAVPVRGMQMGGEPTMAPPAGIAALEQAPTEPAMDMAGMGVGAVDQGTVEQMLTAVAPEIGDPEEAEDFETMMNSVRGDDATVEERRAELATLVGEEDAAQTPESVLALVQPVVQMSMVDQGIGGLAEQEMQQPVQGDMAGGIMSMMGG